MRHLNKGRQLSRTHAHKKALLKNLVTSLLRHERIVTTLAKAKEMRSLAERCVTYAKKGSLHHRRLAARVVNDAETLHKLFSDVAGRFAARAGGYTRITKIGWRKGDAAEMAVIELIAADEAPKAKRRTAAGAASAAPVTSKESFGS